MTNAVIAQWKKANVEFQPPVVIQEAAIKIILKTAWETAQKISLKKITKTGQNTVFEVKLDKLLDITKCRCDIKCIVQCGFKSR